jgi:hypothetical protein
MHEPKEKLRCALQTINLSFCEKAAGPKRGVLSANYKVLKGRLFSMLSVWGGYDGWGGKTFGAMAVAADSGGGDRMLEHQLLECAAFQDHGVLIERTHAP